MVQYRNLSTLTNCHLIYKTLQKIIAQKNTLGQHLRTGDPFSPKPEESVAFCTTLLPVAIKTNTADGPLSVFTTLFSSPIRHFMEILHTTVRFQNVLF